MSNIEELRKLINLFESTDKNSSMKTLDPVTPESIKDFYRQNGFVDKVDRKGTVWKTKKTKKIKKSSV